MNSNEISRARTMDSIQGDGGQECIANRDSPRRQEEHDEIHTPPAAMRRRPRENKAAGVPAQGAPPSGASLSNAVNRSWASAISGPGPRPEPHPPRSAARRVPGRGGPLRAKRGGIHPTNDASRAGPSPTGVDLGGEGPGVGRPRRSVQSIAQRPPSAAGCARPSAAAWIPEHTIDQRIGR